MRRIRKGIFAMALITVMAAGGNVLAGTDSSTGYIDGYKCYSNIATSESFICGAGSLAANYGCTDKDKVDYVLDMGQETLYRKRLDTQRGIRYGSYNESISWFNRVFMHYRFYSEIQKDGSIKCQAKTYFPK